MGSLKERNVARIQTSYVQQKEQKKQQQMQKRRGLIRRLTFIGALFCVLSGLFISTVLSQASTIEEKKEQKLKAEEELSALKKEEQNLEEEIIKLNDDEYIAKIARRDYYLSNDGEIIFNLPNNEEAED